MNERYEIFKKLNEESLELYKAKNADYGNSFSKSYKEFGLTAPIIRMSDKLERLKTLSKQDAKVKDESIKDTLIDLSNYAFMTVIEMECESNDFIFSPLTDYEKTLINLNRKGMEYKLNEEYTEGRKLNI
ncbi:nucleotide modification associated domain-containing protein [Anaerococcus cruorum]|uniref:Nucleotide modification associated domain-containing protein n=1 Tax=Anaerococcus cruorum TaxID=3115617 RepID=A0ABW9MWA9_9FIRM